MVGGLSIETVIYFYYSQRQRKPRQGGFAIAIATTKTAIKASPLIRCTEHKAHSHRNRRKPHQLCKVIYKKIAKINFILSISHRWIAIARVLNTQQFVWMNALVTRYVDRMEAIPFFILFIWSDPLFRPNIAKCSLEKFTVITSMTWVCFEGECTRVYIRCDESVYEMRERYDKYWVVGSGGVRCHRWRWWESEKKNEKKKKRTRKINSTP